MYNIRYSKDPSATGASSLGHPPPLIQSFNRTSISPKQARQDKPIHTSSMIRQLLLPLPTANAHHTIRLLKPPLYTPPSLHSLRLRPIPLLLPLPNHLSHRLMIKLRIPQLIPNHLLDLRIRQPESPLVYRIPVRVGGQGRVGHGWVRGGDHLRPGREVDFVDFFHQFVAVFELFGGETG
jgi:hypothetical protein